VPEIGSRIDVDMTSRFKGYCDRTNYG